MGQLAVLGSGSFARQAAEIARLNGHEIVACYSVSKGGFEPLYRGYLTHLEQDHGGFDGVVLGIAAVDRRSLAIRRGLIDWLVERGVACPPLVSPLAFCSEGVELASGVVLSHGAILGLDAEVGPFSICNSGSMIGHTVRIDANVIVAPGAFIGDDVTVGPNSLVGPLAKVLQGVTLAEDTLVGAGCLALRDLKVGQSLWPKPDWMNAQHR